MLNLANENFFEMPQSNLTNSTEQIKVSKYKKDWDKKVNNDLKKQAENTDLYTYIKVLLNGYRTIPNIVQILDKIIEKRASSYVSTSSIFGGKNSTYGEIDHVINLSERKDKLINLYVIVEQILDDLDADDKKFVRCKFIKRQSTEQIASQFQINERTVFRRATRILDKVAINCLKKGYSSSFIQAQMGDEPWLNELAAKIKQDENSNKTRAKQATASHRHQ